IVRPQWFAVFPYTTLFRSMVDSEIVADDCCARWTASWGSAEIKDYIIGDERVYFKDDDDPETVLNNCIGGVDYWEQPEDVVERRSEEHTSELQSRFDLVCR